MRDIISAMKPIAHMHTDMPQKFGIPRNSFLAPHLQGLIVFEPEFALNSAVAGLEEFSHLWVIWQFENGKPGGTAADVSADSANISAGESRAVVAEQSSAMQAAASLAGASVIQSIVADEGVAAAVATAPEQASGHQATNANAQQATAQPTKWTPTVRPPRLGGTERKGVFATRSPFRPNPIGLTCVKLDRVELTEEGPIIHVLGADLRDGTPILDIKPYIPFADCHADATGGWIENAPWNELDVKFPEGLQQLIESEKLPGLVEVLRQDPRRAGSKHEPTRVYHLAYAGYDVSFTVDGQMLTVTAVS